MTVRAWYALDSAVLGLSKVNVSDVGTGKLNFLSHYCSDFSVRKVNLANRLTD